MKWVQAVSTPSQLELFMSLLNFTDLRLPKTASHVVRLTLLAGLLSGCGSSGADVAPVSGRVTLDGAPMAGARIRFQPEAGGGSPSYGAADADGNYVLGYNRNQSGALIGWHTVSIERGGHGDSPSNSKPQPLPARYNTASELREEVKAGEDNVVDFELTTDAK